MGNYEYRVSKNNLMFAFVNDTNERREWGNEKWSHYNTLNLILKFMEIRGFTVGKDPRIETEYPSLSKDHWYGRLKDLEFKAERYPRGFNIEFYQNINIKNKNGGEYDFDKFDKAPYLIRLLWIKEIKKIEEYVQSIVPGVKCVSIVEYKSSEDKIKSHLVGSWHKAQNSMEFSLSDLDGTTVGESYNNKDRDGNIIYNGEIKYFRDYRGRLQRGKVYHNINNMWWVMINDTEYTNIASFEFFNLSPKDIKVRRKQKTKQKAYNTSRVAARKNFNNKFNYKHITRDDLTKLNDIVGKEIALAAENGNVLDSMRINEKIKTRFYNKKLQHAYLYVDAHYFTKRECISFNPDGFIGFAGWAGGDNVEPILKGFNKWCSYLSENKKVVSNTN